MNRRRSRQDSPRGCAPSARATSTASGSTASRFGATVESVSLSGSTLSPDVVPRYLRSLAADPALKGGQIDEFVIEKSPGPPDVPRRTPGPGDPREAGRGEVVMAASPLRHALRSAVAARTRVRGDRDPRRAGGFVGFAADGTAAPQAQRARGGARERQRLRRDAAERRRLGSAPGVDQARRRAADPVAGPRRATRQHRQRLRVLDSA